jgi:hypothetical protein
VAEQRTHDLRITDYLDDPDRCDVIAYLVRWVTERGKTAVGVTVGLLDQYGPAQRLYAQLGYLPDGRGACRGRNPLRRGETVTIEDDLILWLIKDLRRLIPASAIG